MKIEDRELQFNAGNAKPVIEFFKKYMPVKVVAISDDYLAGVIVHNEWFREKGIRAVYITFEPEASSDAAAWKLIDNSVTWASKFEYKAYKVTKEMAELVKEMVKETKPIERTTVTEVATATKTSTPRFELLAGIVALAFALRIAKK